MVAVVAAGCLGSIALGVLPGIAGKAVVMVVMGAVLLPALPVLMTVAEQLAGVRRGDRGGDRRGWPATSAAWSSR